MNQETREKTEAVRKGLLRLHKTLLDAERRSYEQVYGRVGSQGELLQLVIGHPWFAWLRTLSETVVRLDEMLEADDPAPTEVEGQAALRQVRVLLTPVAGADGFAGRYHEALQQHPEAVVGHAEVVRLLPPTEKPAPGDD